MQTNVQWLRVDGKGSEYEEENIVKDHKETFGVHEQEKG